MFTMLQLYVRYAWAAASYLQAHTRHSAPEAGVRPGCGTKEPMDGHVNAILGQVGTLGEV